MSLLGQSPLVGAGPLVGGYPLSGGGTPLDPPANMAATADTDVDLTADTVIGATDYLLESRTAGDPTWAQIDTNTTPNFTDVWGLAAPPHLAATAGADVDLAAGTVVTATSYLLERRTADDPTWAQIDSDPSPAFTDTWTVARLFGVNIPLWYRGAPMWITWPWATIKGQIDLAVAAGCNAIRVFGNVRLLADATLSTGLYQARLNQFAAYVNSVGLKLYATCFVPQWEGGVSAANVLTYGPYTVDALKDYPNVIGFDLVNESYGYYGATDAKDLYDACKLISSKPMCFSQFVTTNPATAQLAKWDDYDAKGINDYVDIHVYYTPSNASYFDQVASKWPGQRILIGEYGMDTADGNQAARTARYHNILLCGNRTDVSGSLCWDIQDEYQGEADWAILLYGLYAANGTPYQYLLDEIAYAEAHQP